MPAVQAVANTVQTLCFVCGQFMAVMQEINEFATIKQAWPVQVILLLCDTQAILRRSLPPYPPPRLATKQSTLFGVSFLSSLIACTRNLQGKNRVTEGIVLMCQAILRSNFQGTVQHFVRRI